MANCVEAIGKLSAEREIISSTYRGSDGKTWIISVEKMSILLIETMQHKRINNSLFLFKVIILM